MSPPEDWVPDPDLSGGWEPEERAAAPEELGWGPDEDVDDLES